MTTKFSLVRGRALRATRLDGCGGVAFGEDANVVTEGFISVGLTANQEEGETISVTNAAGKVCILDEPAPKFVNYSVEVAFCGVDPDLFNLLTGHPVVLDATGEAVGIGVDSDTNVEDSGFALEMWSNVPVAACDASGSASYGYFLLPFVQGGTLGDVTVENGAINFTMTGAATKDGNEWEEGPYDVVRDSAGDAAPLNAPIPSTRRLHLEVTTVGPPEFTEDGPGALGTPATGATAGSPGAAVPNDGYFPDTLAGMAGVDADPTTAWTTGQYVRIGDGSSAHWSGSAWVAGVAP